MARSSIPFLSVIDPTSRNVSSTRAHVQQQPPQQERYPCKGGLSRSRNHVHLRLFVLHTICHWILFPYPASEEDPHTRSRAYPLHLPWLQPAFRSYTSHSILRKIFPLQHMKTLSTCYYMTLKVATYSCTLIQSMPHRYIQFIKQPTSLPHYAFSRTPPTNIFEIIPKRETNQMQKKANRKVKECKRKSNPIT